jgi:hypothetical protein
MFGMLMLPFSGDVPRPVDARAPAGLGPEPVFIPQRAPEVTTGKRAVLGFCGMKTAAFIAALLLAVPAAGAEAPFPFDLAQVEGRWAENFNTEPACGPDSLHFRFDVSAERKRLTLVFDRRSVTALGETDRVSADILSATPRSLVIRYDNEQRLTRLRKPLEWELTIVAPGVYRWRATDWEPNEVNTVVGVRCSK